MARGLPTGGQGSKVYVLCAEPKEHKHFRPGTRPGGSGTRPGGSVTGMCQMFMCLFRPLGHRHIQESPEPRARNPQKVSKRSGPACQKSVEKVPKEPKKEPKRCSKSYEDEKSSRGLSAPGSKKVEKKSKGG